MTAQRRSWSHPRKRTYAGLFVALATVASVIGIGLTAQPAFAADTATVSASPGTVALSGPGDSKTLTVTVAPNVSPPPSPANITVAVSVGGGSASASDITISGSGSGCSAGVAGQPATCPITLNDTNPVTVNFTLKAASTIGDIVPGTTATFSSSTVSISGDATDSHGFTVTLKGPAPPPRRRSPVSS
ncbi:MAG TPA: hypothetical protein VKB59_15270, partial [Micromonosporaceae bacterium]|nr:hypothetical protein [Micromonosporaceae bacterium]